MMRSLQITLSLTLLCFLAGCGKYWYQDGKTFGECKRDLMECANELRKYSDADQPGFAFGRDYEHKFVQDCMEQRGYRLVTENKLPLRVKRQDPESTYREIRHGIAGTPDE
jgi:hypothetical protein